MDNTPVFNTIKSFVNDLNEIYGSRQKSLALYNRLLSKTRIDHTDAVEKHVQIFKQFNITNRDGIIEKNKDKFVDGTVKYNDRVYINIKHIISTADEDSKKVIWTHLLVISAYLDPASGAKELLKKNKPARTQEMPDFSSMGDMGSMLTNMIGTLQSSVGEVGPNASPMDVFGKIMSSGAFSQVLNMVNGGMENGQIDMAQMMGMAQGMLGQMGGNAGGEGGAPDLSGIFKQLGMDGDQLQQMTKQIEDNVGNKVDKSENASVEVVEE